MKNTTIVFQGDSITDCNRERIIQTIDVTPANTGLGTGYVSLVSAELLSNNYNINIYNRGIGGNRIADMYARWQEDAINLSPDIINILNGVNDIGFGIRCGCGADREKYQFIYDKIIYETLQAKPDVDIILCQPFLLRKRCESGMDIYNDWDVWYNEITERGNIVWELSKKYNCTFVPMREAIEKACEKAPVEHWIIDCIHPTLAGHRILADCWLENTKDVLKKHKII